MGSIESYDTSTGRRYRVRYRKPDHSQTDKRGFRTKREAEQFLATMELSKARGAYVDPSLGRITVERWMELWLATRQDLRAASRTRAAGIVSKHILPALGPIALADLQRLTVQQWASTIEGSPESVRKVVNVLSGALQLAIEDGRISANPAARLKLPKPIRTKRLYLNHEQVAALSAAVEGRSNGRELGYGLLLLVLAYCGLRWGELSGLRVRDVDLKRRRLEVQQTVVADKGYQRIEAPKNYEHRSIPIPELLHPHLSPRWRGEIRVSRSSMGPVLGPGSATTPSATGGSTPQPPRSVSPASPRMNCVTPRPAWRSRPAPTSRLSSGCSAMPRLR